MENSEYQLSYLPLFHKDLTDVVHYIAVRIEQSFCSE